MDNSKISDYLEELIRKRDAERRQNCEFNGWTELDDNAWQERTDGISSAVERIRSERNAEEDVKELKARYAYLAADFDNFRKRTVKDEIAVRDRIYKDAILKIIDIYDDMERLHNIIAVKRQSGEGGLSEEDSGFEIIFKNVEKALADFGCEKLECAVGDALDVFNMEAVSSIEMPDESGIEPGAVAQILQSGWKRKGCVIRPVKVATRR